MTIDLELIRSRNPIEDVVGEKFALKKTGKRFIGIEHDSLVVIPNTGFYFWNSRGEQGDVFDFVGRHILGYGNWNNRNADQFMESVTMAGTARQYLAGESNRFSPITCLDRTPAGPAVA